jgi:hypothetical protein
MHCTCHFVVDRTSEDEAILPYTETNISKSSPTITGRLARHRKFGKWGSSMSGPAMRAVNCHFPFSQI